MEYLRMKISRINRACARQETALPLPRAFGSAQTQSDVSVLHPLQARLKELPEISEWRIASMQLALQHEEISPNSVKIAAAMMEWFCSNESR